MAVVSIQRRTASRAGSAAAKKLVTNIRLLISSPAAITGPGWWLAIGMVIQDSITSTTSNVTNMRIASFVSVPSSGTIRKAGSAGRNQIRSKV